MLHALRCASKEGGISANVEEGEEEGSSRVEELTLQAKRAMHMGYC